MSESTSSGHLDYVKNNQNSIFRGYFGSRGGKIGPWHPFR
jgi:hypothetical protein